MAIRIATEINCSYMPPEEGERIRIFDEEITVKVTGGETAGAYALVTMSVAPGGGPPLHAHPGNETFFVLSGEFAFTQRDTHGTSTFRAGPGAVVHAPSGAPHRFENISPTRSTLRIIFPPETIAFLQDLGRAFPPGARPDMETMLALNAKHDITVIYGGEGSRPEPPQEGATSTRSRAIAWRFGQANEALIATIEQCTPEQWRAVCADTGWTVGVQAHHVAAGEAALAGVIRDVAEGRPHPPMPPEMLDAINARHAEEFANVTQEETIALLRENGALAAALYRSLSDSQLARTAILTPDGSATSAAQLIEYLAIGEIERHGEYLRNAISHP
jgi:quercetin dioxygenase-like cupin family protein